MTRVQAAAPRALSPRAGWSSLVVVLAGAVSILWSIERANGQDAERPKISVAPTIVAEPASQASLAITIGRADIVPKKSFVSLRGLPPSVSLTEGHAIGPGSWAIPLAGLPTLKANIPTGITGRAEIIISLIGMDGTLLAEAKTALILPAEPPPARLAAPAPHTSPKAALARPAPEHGNTFARAGADIARQGSRALSDAR